METSLISKKRLAACQNLYESQRKSYIPAETQETILIHNRYMLSEATVRTIGRRLRQYGYKTYAEYLKSEHWQDVRRRFFKSKLYKGSCYCCSAKGPVEVHHRTYSRLGRERLTDLIALCGICHNRTHENVIYGKQLRNAHKPIWREHQREQKKEKEWANSNCNRPRYWQQNREIDAIRDRIFRDAH